MEGQRERVLRYLAATLQFSPLQPITTPVVRLSCTVAGDFDGDGDQDLIAVDRFDEGSVSVEAVGPGTFAVPVRVDLGSDPIESAIVADVTEDGALDLIVATRQTVSSLSILAGRGDGTFEPPRSLGGAGLMDVTSIRLMDLDSDGDQDIVVTADGGPSLSWIENERRVPLGTSYCGPAQPNSAGLSARMSAVGSDRVPLNELRLRAYDLPSGSSSIFLASTVQGFVPAVTGSVGALCLGGSIGRFQGPGQVLSASADGAIELAVDLAQIPQPGGGAAALPGSIWFFQAWYRDSVGGQSVSNFSDGRAVVFRP